MSSELDRYQFYCSLRCSPCLCAGSNVRLVITDSLTLKQIHSTQVNKIGAENVGQCVITSLTFLNVHVKTRFDLDCICIDVLNL